MEIEKEDQENEGNIKVRMGGSASQIPFPGNLYAARAYGMAGGLL